MTSPVQAAVEAPTRNYWCFISYRHADNQQQGRQWASWLHQAIETYEVPEDLVGKVNDRGDTIPALLYPVFRDEEELPADAELSAPINRALRGSRFLVVVCSPAAIESRFVDEEIRTFKILGKADRALAMIIRGEPNVSRDRGKQSQGISVEQECFPLSLRQRFDPSGEVLDEGAEPIGADFRLEGQTEGWTSPEALREELARQKVPAGQIAARVKEYAERSELMKLKILAGILGVSLGVLTQRDKAYQLAQARRKARTLRRWLTAVILLGILMLVAAGIAFMQRRAAETQRQIAETARDHAVTAREQAEQLIDFMVGDLQHKLAPIGQLGLAKSVNQRVAAYYRTQGREGQATETLERRAMLYDNLGDVQMAEGAWDDARTSYYAALEIRQDLALREPGSPEWQWCLSISNRKQGDLYRAQKKWPAAQREYETSRKICQDLTARDRIRSVFWRGLCRSHELVGDMQESQGLFDDALVSYHASLAIREPLRPEGDTELQNGLRHVYTRIGDLHFRRKAWADALKNFQTALSIAEDLVRHEPDEALWQRELWSTCWRVAAAKTTLKQPEAIEHWRRASAIMSGMKKKGLLLSAEDEQSWEEATRGLKLGGDRPSMQPR